jgi:Cys-tRNA(Pro) deacylase
MFKLMKKGVELVKAYFEDIGMEKKIFAFDDSTENAAKAAQTLGVELGQIAKSILFFADKTPVLIVISGDKKVDEKKLKSLLSVKKVRLAKPEEVYEVTGFEVGGVSPVGIKNQINVFIDESLKRFDIIYPAAGESNNMFITSFDELVKLSKAKIVNVAKEL